MDDWGFGFLVFVMGFAAGAIWHPMFLRFLERYLRAADRNKDDQDRFHSRR